jgi:hypothetical protein
MGLVVGRHTRWLLDAGWSLTLVGDNVPADLADACNVLLTPAPRCLPSHLEHVAWCRRARNALRTVRADIVHVHSPLLSQQADLLTAHFISQPAFARGARERSRGVSGALRRAQAGISRHVDNRAYLQIDAATHVSFVSEFLRDEYIQWYGTPAGAWVFAPPAPPWRPVSEAEREAARLRFGVPPGSICVGYLGGADPRKGYPHLQQLTGAPGFSLLLAGPGSEEMTLAGRRGIGFVDIDELHAACDVVAAPAVFDSAPVAVLQAISRDIPVVTTAQCGWAPAISRRGGGVVWDRSEPLTSAITRACEQTSRRQRQHLLAEFDEQPLRETLLSAYSSILSGSARD